MTPAGRPATTRGVVVLSLARGAIGVGLLVWPSVALQWLGGRPDQPARRFTRVLGARHVLEAAMTAAHPTARTLRAGAAVDAVHAATMIFLLPVTRRRRLVLINVCSAAVFAAAGATAASAVKPARAGAFAR